MPKENEGQEKVIDQAIKNIEGRFGDGIIRRCGDMSLATVEVISTGSWALDIALHIGGLPRGRIVDFYGAPSTGKSLLALTTIAQAQIKELKAAYIDCEYSFDPQWAQKLGVDVENLYVVQPDGGEQAFEIAEALIRTGAFGVIVLDSTAALIAKEDVATELGENRQPGSTGRLMAMGLKKLTAVIGKTKTIFIFINQIREKIGIAYGQRFTTTGGGALPFYCSVRVEVKKAVGGWIKDANKNVLGHRVEVKVAKSKVSPPFGIGQFDLYYESGVDSAGEIFLVGLQKGVIQKAGKVLTFQDIKWTMGEANALEEVRKDEKLQERIVTAVQGG